MKRAQIILMLMFLAYSKTTFMTFKDLNITESILKAIEEKGYVNPTPIQAKAIPALLVGKDILGCAQTGTGKTAAFAIPIIQQLQADKSLNNSIKALILTPTRELALQISECIDDYAKYTQVRHGVIFGGVNQRTQVNMLHKGVDILVATPGRLLDLMNQGYVRLNNIQHFVLDEADRMLDMGFIHDIKRLLPKLPKEKHPNTGPRPLSGSLRMPIVRPMPHWKRTSASKP